MRYQLELEVGVPRAGVIELFLDPANLAKWQPDLVSLEQISGAPREVGAISRQVHKMGGREVEMIETITAHNHLDEYSATYEADGVWNLVENCFFDLGDGRTRWVLDSEFKCSRLVPKLMALFAPGIFRKQTLTFMHRFKDFAETSGG